MSSVSVGKQDLSLAQSIGELNKKVEVADKISKSSNPKIWLNSADKVFKKAEHSDMMKDEENAYVLYMRFLYIMQEAKKTTKYQQDKKYYGNLVSAKSQLRAIEQAEKLSTSLEERYEKLQLETERAKEKENKAKEEEAKAQKQVKNANDTSISMKEIDDLLSGKKPTTQTSSDVFKKIQVDHGTILSPQGHSSARKKDPLGSSTSPLKPSQVIDPVTLYQLLSDKNKKDDILILDTRSKKDFELSRISYSCCINIPDDLLKTSVHVGSIERKLPTNTWDLWITRREKAHIVILDQDTKYVDVTPASKIQCLKDAIHLYDTSCSLRSEPVILDGGFEAWLWHYPSLVTNPMLPKKTPAKNIEPNVNIESLSYPELPVSSEKPQPTLTGGKKDRSLKNDSELPQVPNRSETSQNAPSNNRSSANQHTSLNGPQASHEGVPLRPNGRASATVTQPNPTGSVNPNMAPKPFTATQPALQDTTSRQIIPNKPYPAAASNKHPSSLNYPLSGANNPTTSLNVPHSFPDYPSPSVHFPSTSINVPPPHNHPATSPNVPPSHSHPPTPRNVTPLYPHPASSPDVPPSHSHSQTSLNVFPSHSHSAVSQTSQLKPSVSLAPGTRLNVSDHGHKPSPPQVGHTDTAVVPSVRPANNEISRGSQEDAAKVPTQVVSLHGVSLPGNDVTSLSTSVTPDRSAMRSTPNNQPGGTPVQPHNSLPSSGVPQNSPSGSSPAVSSSQLGQHGMMSSQSGQHGVTSSAQPPENVKPRSLAGNSPPSRNMEPTSNDQTPPTVSTPQPSIPSVPQKFTGSRTGMTHGLPPGWERVLDARMGRYYFQDHNTKTTHWNLPSSLAKSINESLMGQNVTAKDVETKKPSLKRSLSSPNLAKLDEKSESITGERSSRPVVNRRTKPLTENQLLNLAPAHGGQGKALTGLRNLGNSCYMNSVLQCLISTAPLVKYILNSYYVEDINKMNPLGTGGRIAEELAVLTRVAHSGSYRYVSPVDFKRTIGRFAAHFGGHQQQDSQEFLLFLLDQFHEDTNKVVKKAYIEEKSNDGLPDRVAANVAWGNHKTRNQSIIVELLQGLFKSTLICDVCNKQSVTFDAFMSLTLPIPTNGSCQIEDCIRLFTTKEKVSKDNRWFCPRCKQHREAWKKMEIWKLPPILIVHFNRFKRDYDGSWLEKRQNYVNFPLGNFDMSKFVLGPKKSLRYNLYGVSNHYGSMQSGHYTAFCKNIYDKKWHKFDDEIVSNMSESSTKSSAAYILFYTSIEFNSP